jgi:hypothetical protein
MPDGGTCCERTQDWKMYLLRVDREAFPGAYSPFRTQQVKSLTGSELR